MGYGECDICRIAVDYAKLNKAQREVYMRSPENWPPTFPYYYALAHTPVEQ